jgi:hypothetical protein
MVKDKYMQRNRLLPVTFSILFLAVSCIDHDILNISDTLGIHSGYSVPVGEFDYNINRYLSSLDTVSFPWPDSLYYNDVLYPSFNPVIDLALVDTFSFNLVKDPSAKVRSLEFVILVSNGYPTKISAQVYFLYGTSKILKDSLFSSGAREMPPADINHEGLVTQPSISLFTVPMPPEFILQLAPITGIMVRVRVNTNRPDLHWIKFYNNYQINLHIGTRVELLYTTGKN